MRRMTRVLFVTHFDLAQHSGSNVATRSVIRALCRQDNAEVTLLSPVPVDGSDLASDLPVAAWERLPARTRFSGWWQMVTAARVRSRLKCLLGEPDAFDVVVARYGPFFVPATLLFPRRGTRLVLLIRGTMPLGLPGLPGRLVESLARRLSLAVATRADRLLFAFEDAVGNVRRKLPSDRIRIIPNGADLTAFPKLSQSEARQSLEQEGGLKLEGKVVGFAGSIRPRHCLEELLQASSHLHRRGLAHRILIVGDGPVRPRLEEMALELEIQPSVHFTGRVPHGEVGRYLSACDVLYSPVHPSNPSNPIKVYEGLAAGRPVVTSPRPELLFVAEQRFGVLAKGHDLEALVAALEEGLSLDWTGEDAQRGRAYIEKHHTWDTVAKEILSV